MIERFARLLPARLNPWGATNVAAKMRLPTYSAGGPNLEVLKFGMYIMFPIGWMYYFGTNLENRFSVPDFWPDPETTHKIPFEKEDQVDMVNKLKAARLERRRKRLQAERVSNVGVSADGDEAETDLSTLAAVREPNGGSSGEAPREVPTRNMFKLGLLDRWASGKQ